MKFLDPDLMALDVEADLPEEAIRQAGGLMVAAGTVSEDYVEAMVDSYVQNGAYFVIAPGIAIPHAKADNKVKEGAVSFIRLKRPISFGHPVNDPVQLVFAIGGTSGSEHIAMLRKLTLLLNDPQNIDLLKTAGSLETIDETLRGDSP